MNTPEFLNISPFKSRYFDKLLIQLQKAIWNSVEFFFVSNFKKNQIAF